MGNTNLSSDAYKRILCRLEPCKNKAEHFYESMHMRRHGIRQHYMCIGNKHNDLKYYSIGYKEIEKEVYIVAHVMEL